MFSASKKMVEDSQYQVAPPMCQFIYKYLVQENKKFAKIVFTS